MVIMPTGGAPRARPAKILVNNAAQSECRHNGNASGHRPRLNRESITGATLFAEPVRIDRELIEAIRARRTRAGRGLLDGAVTPFELTRGSRVTLI